VAAAAARGLLHPHLRKKSKIPTRPPLPTKLLAAGENSPFNRRDLAMESLFRRTTSTGSGFDALKRLGHISPAVQSHLKHAGPLLAAFSSSVSMPSHSPPPY